MEFGPEIKVDGVRPEWLLGSDRFEYQTVACGGSKTCWHSWLYPEWSTVTAIRLPATHPRYNLITHTYTVRPEDEAALLASDPLSRPTRDERAVAPELVERMRALIETMASCDGAAFVLEYKDQARAIVAALEPVDPMLLEARKIVADQYGEGGNVAHLREQALSGEGDEWFHTKVAKAALARGRALAHRDVTPCTREQFEEECRI